MSMRNGGEDYYRTHPSELTEQLFLAAFKGLNTKCLLDLGITSIVNATLELPTIAYQKQETIQIAVEDRVAAKLNIYFDLIADKIQQVHSAGGKIMIYCRAGQSRSATLCIAYFMKYHSMTYEQAFQYVKARRPIIHPNIGFVRQLKDFEKKLADKASVPKNPSFKKVKRSGGLDSLSFAEDVQLDEIEFYPHEEVPIKPCKPRRARISMQEPIGCLVERCEIVPVLECDKVPRTNIIGAENSTIDIQEPRPVASSTIPSHTIGQLGDLPEHSMNGRAKRKTAFSRLAKPHDIAVSFMNIPLFFVNFNSKTIHFKDQIKTEHCSSVISELQQTHAVSEEIFFECVGNIATQQNKVIINDQQLNKVTKQDTFVTLSVRPEKARIILAPFQELVTHQLIQVLENTITYNEKILTKSLNTASKKSKTNYKSHAIGKNIVSLKPHNKLKSIVEPNSSKPTKCVVTLTENDFGLLLHSPPPILWESLSTKKVDDTLTINNKTERPMAVLSCCNSISTIWPVTWENVPESISKFNIPIDYYHKLDFSFTSFEDTSQVALITIQTILGSATVDCSKRMTVSRQLPHYFTVFITSALDLNRAEEETKLKVQWFKIEKPPTQSPNPVELVRKISQSKMEEQKRKVSQPQMKWATACFCTDEFYPALPVILAKQPSFCQAQPLPPGRLCEHFCRNEEPLLLFHPNLLGRFYVPHYNPVLLKKDCDLLHKPVATASNIPGFVFELTNIFSVPRFISGLNGAVQAEKSIYIPDNLTSSCLTTVLINIADVRNQGEEDVLEEIPDQIFDINEIKQILAEDSDSPKCKIWFDVFKRTLMKKRPTHAQCVLSFTINHAAAVLEHFSLPEYISFILPTKPAKQKLATSKLIFSCNSIASIKEIEEIDNLGDFASESRVNTKLEYVATKLSTSEALTMTDNAFVCEETKTFLNLDSFPSEKCTSSVCFPYSVYNVGYEQVLGLTSDKMDTAEGHQRIPFSVVSRLYGAADILLPHPHFMIAPSLPDYQFVQDIEDQADLIFHQTEVIEIAVATEIDSFWFFSLETAATPQSDDQIEDATGLLKYPSNYLLFLPDREMAGRIGQEELNPDEASDIAESDIDIVNPDAIVAEIKSEIGLEIKSLATSQKPGKDKRVTFSKDATETFADIQCDESMEQKKRIKTIYYGRDKSKSRSKLKEVPTRQKIDSGKTNRRDRSSSRYNEADVLKNLENSVNEANSILIRRSRRIGEDVSLPPDPFTSPLSPSTHRVSRLESRSEERYARRSRDEERNKRETERFKRNAIGPQNTAGDMTPGLTGGLLSIAHNFFSGKSRRDLSRERSKALLRKSRTFI